MWSEAPQGMAAAPPPLSVGHHGLIALDADANLADLNHGPTLWSVGPLDANVQNLLYLTPNRVLNPRLGRWLQADPIASGLPVHASIALGGRPAVAAGSVDEVDLRGRFGDGVNLYQYARGNPVTGGDPTGLMLGALDLGMSTGIRGFIGGALAGGMPTAGSISAGMATAGGLATVAVSATGALVMSHDWGVLVNFSSTSPRDRYANRGASGGSAGNGKPATVIQTGGKTLKDVVARTLGMTKEQAKRAMEALKDAAGRASNNHNHKIWSDGSVTDSQTGNPIGNLKDYIH